MSCNHPENRSGARLAHDLLPKKKPPEGAASAWCLVVEQQIAATDQDEHCGDAPQQDYWHGSLLSFVGVVSRALQALIALVDDHLIARLPTLFPDHNGRIAGLTLLDDRG